jgi:hypothetical protein
MNDMGIQRSPDFDYERLAVTKRVYYLTGRYLAKRLTRKEHDELDQLIMSDEAYEEIFSTLCHRECMTEFFKAVVGLKQDR